MPGPLRSRARRTSSTVSHSSGANTLATWGAKTGEWHTTWRAGTVRDDLAVRQHDGPVAHTGRQLDVVRGQHDGMSVVSQLPQDRDEAVFAGVVQPSSRFVEQQEGGTRCQHDRQRQGEPLSLGQVAGVAVAGHTGQDPLERVRGRPLVQAGHLVGRTALGLDALAVEEETRILRDQPHVADQIRRGETSGGPFRPPPRCLGSADVLPTSWRATSTCQSRSSP